MAKIITLGEIMLRLSPPGNKRFVQAQSFDVVYGGGEANVAVSLSNFGHNASFVSKLPQNEIGQSAINELRKYGVDTSNILRGGSRIGIYYLEHGASMRPSKVIYDRANSSISEAEASEFDWDAIFEGADWFHWSGITPALSDTTKELTIAACKAAKKHDVTISCDLNYRKKLWNPAEAQETMKNLMQYVDVCIGNEEDAKLVLGYESGSDVTSGELDLSGYKDIFKRMKDDFDFTYIASTLRESHSASDNGWSSLIYDGNEFYHSKHYDIHIVDRVGGGDSFSAGLIHGLLEFEDMKQALEFATAASALKHTIPGDQTRVSIKEAETLMHGDASGRVQR